MIKLKLPNYKSEMIKSEFLIDKRVVIRNPEFNGMSGRIQRVRGDQYEILLDDGRLVEIRLVNGDRLIVE